MNLLEDIRTFINNLLNRGEPIAGAQPQTLAQRLAFSRHHLLYFSLIFGVLGVILLWQSFGAPAPVVATVEAENMQLPDGASLITSNHASAGRAVVVTKNGTLTFTGALNSDTASIAIRAYGGRCDNTWPKITVAIDDRTVFTMDVSANSWHDFERDLRVVKGTHKLSISFVNASSDATTTPTAGIGNGNCLRTLYLDKITFFGQPASDPPPVPAPPPPASPTLNFSASPTSVASGGSSTLTWSTTNADTCIASGAWSGTKAVSGSQSTGALTSTQAYTLTCSGSGGSVVRSVTVTVTATPSPPPPPPPAPTPPPPVSGTCLVSNRTSWALGGQTCRFGHLITRTNQTFACNQPLSNYGTLPIKVVIVNTAAWDAAGAVTVDNGCRGDGNSDTIDLIVDIQGNGPKSSTGPGADSFKTRQGQGPRDIQLTGRMECGRQASGAHQDFVQFQGGTNIAIVNATTGNYAAGLSTCQGAGGMIFSSSVVNIDILGGEYIACNHGILGGSSGTNPGGEVRDTKFRSGRNDGTDPNCNYAPSNPCQTSIPMTNVTCQRWNYSSKTWVNQ